MRRSIIIVHPFREYLGTRAPDTPTTCTKKRKITCKSQFISPLILDAIENERVGRAWLRWTTS